LENSGLSRYGLGLRNFLALAASAFTASF
jgi:hypothetical protein